jgi:hypothetical protein
VYRGFFPASIVVVVLILIASVAACAPTTEPSPTPSPSGATSTPTSGSTNTPSPVSPTPTVPTAVPATTPSLTPPPTPTAELSRGGTIALYSAGPPDQASLYALTSDGSMTDLGRAVYPQAAVSADGRWVATTDSPLAPEAVVASNLETGTIYTVPVTSDFESYGMAFDSEAARLAFVEIGSPGSDGTPWALAVVSMEDGSTVRFGATTGPDNTLLPGSPIGWSGDELLLDTFIPYSDALSTGLWAVTLPPDVDSTSFDELDRREVLSDGSYLFNPRLSPDASRLLYLGRDYDYTPDNYGPVGYDLAVNQLGLLDVESDTSTPLVEETEGGALGGDVAWSPDGSLGLFASGRYDGGTFASLTLKTVDATGTVTEVAPIPLPTEGFLVSLDWCAQDTALVVVAADEGVYQLHAMDLASGESSLLASDDEIGLLGCVRGADGGAGAEGGAGANGGASAGGGAANADVVYVRAVASGEGTWTFHVTVEHPDTGWEDYADGWDVVTPDGEVLKPDPESDFTRTLLHPHVDEQPFTRSQSGIVIPEGVAEVRVRAHDIVDGYGGEEVVVDLTKSSGPNFEVEQE